MTTTNLPRPAPAGSALLEGLVDTLAVRAHRRTGLGRLGHRKDFTAQRNDVRAHHGAFGDLVLLDVMEVLRGIAVGPVVDAFVGVGALDGLGVHATHCAATGYSPVGQVVRKWSDETQPRAGFRRRWSTDPHHRRRARI